MQIRLYMDARRRPVRLQASVAGRPHLDHFHAEHPSTIPPRLHQSTPCSSSHQSALAPATTRNARATCSPFAMSQGGVQHADAQGTPGDQSPGSPRSQEEASDQALRDFAAKKVPELNDAIHALEQENGGLQADIDKMLGEKEQLMDPRTEGDTLLRVLINAMTGSAGNGFEGMMARQGQIKGIDKAIRPKQIRINDNKAIIRRLERNRVSLLPYLE